MGTGEPGRASKFSGPQRVTLEAVLEPVSCVAESCDRLAPVHDGYHRPVLRSQLEALTVTALSVGLGVLCADDVRGTSLE